jgi:hypothetical protein
MLIDVARAHAQRRRITEAVAALREAKEITPEQVRSHELGRLLVSDPLTMQDRLTAKNPIYTHIARREAQGTRQAGRHWRSQSQPQPNGRVTVDVKRPGRSNPPGRSACSRWVVRGGVEPPTFRFSGVIDVQASDVAAAWTVAEVRRWSGSVAVVAVTVAVG